MSKTSNRIRHDYKEHVVKKIEEAVKIAEQIDEGNLSNFDKYSKIINHLEKKVGFKDANKIVQQWD